MDPTVFAEGASDVFSVIAQIVGPAAAGVLAYFWKKFQRMHGQLMRKLDTLDEMKTRLDVIEPIARKLKADFSPNGGSSILDVIQKIQSQLCVVDARARVVWATSRDGVYECDAEGRNIWANASLTQLFGMDAADMTGSGWLKGVAREDRERAWTTWVGAVRLGIPYEDVYTVVNQRTGDRNRCRTYTLQTVDPTTKKIIGYFGLVMREDGSIPWQHPKSSRSAATGHVAPADRVVSADGPVTPPAFREPQGESDVA